MTTAPLFFIDALPSDATVLLAGDEGRHAARVRRLGVGEPVLVGDGLGAVLECVVDEVRPDGLALSVLRRRFVAAPDPRVVVVQALPKADRGELAVELMTELGVDEIVPWAAERSQAQWQGPRREKGMARWRRTAREAAKQSRRARVSAVADLATTADVAGLVAGACGLVLHESAAQPLAAVPLPRAGDVVLVVGPEGGIGDAELDSFGAAGAVTVRLGAPVLRTSTAGAAALAALSVRLGRWS